jgi:hypothetical protein
MATFAQTQKLARVQPPLVPKQIRRRKKKKQQFNFENIFKLPSDIVNYILTHHFDLEEYYLFERILILREICKSVSRKVNKYCYNICREKLSFEQRIPIFKLYHSMILYDDIKISKNEMICYRDENTEYYRCRHNNGFFISGRCAFECRKYHCPNRNCEDYFAWSYDRFNLDNLICMCGINLELSIKGVNNSRCRQDEYYTTPFYALCFDPINSRYARYVCNKCNPAAIHFDTSSDDDSLYYPYNTSSDGDF